MYKLFKFRPAIILAVAAFAFCLGQTHAFLQNLTVAKTTISNYAAGSYRDDSGAAFDTVSATVSISVSAVSVIVVTPNQTTPSEIIAPNDTIVREFKVCNSSNFGDSYTLIAQSVTSPAQITGTFLDANEDGLISPSDPPISLNQALSNIVAPGSCMKILVRIDTGSIGNNQDLVINLTVRSNNPDAVNGQAEASGTIINSGGNAPIFTNPQDPTLKPLKLVEDKATYVAGQNEPLEYSIAFQNKGDVDARRVVLTDRLAPELSYLANTLKLDGKALTDAQDSDEGEFSAGTIIIKLASPVKPDEVLRITFKATVTGNTVPGKGVVNFAEISSENAPAVRTTEAIAIIDPFGTVFAARGGAASPIPGATVTILAGGPNGTPLSLPAGPAFEPNLDNLNPYLTDNRGRFSFGLSPGQLGSQAQPAVYIVSVTAADFRPRLLEISLSPDGNGLFRMTVRPLDGLPLAVADGFELTQSGVEISSIADIAFNIPMFEEAILIVNKTVDRSQAEIGDVANYRIEIGNSSVAPILNVLVYDNLPASFSYVPGTGRISRNGVSVPIEPVVSQDLLEFRIGDLASGENVSLHYRVRIGANANQGDNYNSAVVSGRFPSDELAVSDVSRALVKVSPGLFSMQQFVIGRIFVDDNDNGVFDFGEQPVDGARVYLSNGNSSTTDWQGLYSIPAVSDGAQVVALDPITIPVGYLLADSRSRSGKDWTRLLRTPLGGGGMLRQNFVLVADVAALADDATTVKTKSDITPAAESDPEKKSTEPDALVYSPVVPGEIQVHGLTDKTVVRGPALNVDVSVASGWSASLELNGRIISGQSIGKTRTDPKNRIVTYSFVGLGLKPGPNTLRARPISPGNSPGESVSFEVYGRGPATSLKITAERNELQASGRDSTMIVIKAFDQWEHPAQDGSILIETSLGRLIDPADEKGKRKSGGDSKPLAVESLSTNGRNPEQAPAAANQRKVDLVGGIGVIKLISENRTGTARITASLGKVETTADIRFTSEIRTGFLAGLAELTVGKNAPEMINRGVDQNIRGHIQFFYKGKIFGDQNLLTLAYDSQEPLNRISGRDRLFQLNPLDHVYPLFGDSSSRYQETESNSKVYARFDRGRSYAMFGDFESGLETSRLLGYSRKLTGGKIHIENDEGDFVTVTGARPDTAFARQVIPGGSLGLVQLAYGEILPGSEVLSLETRDRRNPEVILSREILSRSVDYNIDTSTGTIFFLRQIPTFDRELNLTQVLATYEYRAGGFESSIYTARAGKNIDKLGLRLGFSYIRQMQAESRPFQLGGLDASVKLPNGGRLLFEWARSRGALIGGFGFFGNSPSQNGEFNGDAFYLSIEQPLPQNQTVLRFAGQSASRNFYNPFGGTITPGNTRGVFSAETKPLKNSTLKATLIAERNLTENVDNKRITAGVDLTQTVNEKLRFKFAYDFRKFTDSNAERAIVSNLITAGAEINPTAKLDFSIRREQNLGDEDPSYPNQTIIGANYQFSQTAKLFFTQRLASNPITPISDVSGTGFASSNARYETAVGVESRFGKYTSMSGRYQLESGINGTDSFSIIGLQNRFPVSNTLSLELGYERAFHLAGEGRSYNNFTIGGNWLPDENFRTSFRYELRDRNGFGQLFSLGAAGKIKPGWTSLGRLQYGDIDYNGRKNLVMNGQLALAIRPHDTDKYGVLLSYKRRESFFSTTSEETPNEMRSDLLSVDGFHQTTRRLELYGRFAAKFTADRSPEIPAASNLTYLMQGRAQYRVTRWMDLASEGRYLYQPSSGSKNRWLGIEAGYWATPDLRIGAGYNFKQSTEVFGFSGNQVYNRGGFYFTISTKVSRLFDLFGTPKKGLEHERKRKLNKDTARKRK